ncbi:MULTISPECIES: hypothetical protein [Cupriavidus]
MDPKFWDGKRWSGHRAFDTVTHAHLNCYDPAPGRDTCDIMVVGCRDGRWYVEDNWGGDAKGAEKVWNPFDPSNAGPHFFASEDEALQHACAVVADLCGVDAAGLMPD